MKNIIFFNLFLLSIFGYEVRGQERKIEGKVTDAVTKEPLPGGTVLVKDTQIGTITDADGNYRITLPDGGTTLIFSFIGYTTAEILVADKTNLDIALDPDVEQLSEVVVSALGIERNRNSLPYAATQVQGADITVARNPNMINSLSGKVAGLNITQTNTLGGSTNVVIRGTKSLTGSNQALFVIDGVPINNDGSNSINQVTGRGGFDFGNPAADINPDDIASMNVLKGAAATALYGSRASNGVILITTKKGKKGLGVTINSGVTFGFVDKQTVPEYQKQYGAGYGEYWEEYDVNGDGVSDNVVPFSNDASYGFAFDPTIMVYQWDALDPSSPNYLKPRPWVAAENGPEYFFENAVSSNNNIMIDGGNDIGTFKLGYTNNTEEGMLPNSKITKNIINFGGSLNLTSKLKASASVNFSQQDAVGRYGSGYSPINPMLGLRQWFQTNVDLKEQKDAYFRTRKNITWNWNEAGDLRAAYSDNVYFTRHENYSTDSRYRTFGYIETVYEVSNWFDIKSRASIDSYDMLQEERFSVGSTLSETDPYYKRYTKTFREFNFDLFANFKGNISKSFSIMGLAGMNIRRSELNSLSASTSGGLVVPGLYALSNSLNLLAPPIETQESRAVDGIFANATLGYKELLFLDLTARRDQSSTLPKDNNTYVYPSTALSFAFSEMLKEYSWLSYGKAWVNYAEVGNDAPFAAINKYYNKQNEESGEPVGGFNGIPLYSVPNTRFNGKLKPERTKSAEAGVEMAFLESRIGFNATIYKANTINQILPVSVPTTTGYSYKYVNAGEVENKGIEAILYFTPVNTESFQWTVNVNWTRNQNKVVSLAEGDNMELALYSGGVTANATVGRPFGVIRGEGFVIHENGGKIVGEDGQYVFSAPTKEIADPNPKWTGGVSNTLSYKGLTLYFLIDVKKGGQLFNLDTYYGFGTGLYPETAGLNDLGNPSRLPISEGGGIILPGVKEDGSSNDIRIENTEGVFGYYAPFEAHVYDAGFIKLREASLTYSLPKSFISRLKAFKGVDISIVGRNLWIIDKDLPYSDPESGFGAGNLGQGYLGGAYPTARNIGFNLRLKF